MAILLFQHTLGNNWTQISKLLLEITGNKRSPAALGQWYKRQNAEKRKKILSNKTHKAQELKKKIDLLCEQQPKLGRREQWTKDEDEELLYQTKRYGKNWKKVAEKIEGKTARQCGQRYASIDPTIDRSPLTKKQKKTTK